MIKTNIKAGINILERVKALPYDAFDETAWQDDPSAVGVVVIKIRGSWDGLVKHRMTASLGGWLALSPEFQAQGGYIAQNGAPLLRVGEKVYKDESAIAIFFGITKKMAEKITCTLNDTSIYDNIEDAEELTPQHVIDKLKELLAEGGDGE